MPSLTLRFRIGDVDEETLFDFGSAALRLFVHVWYEDRHVLYMHVHACAWLIPPEKRKSMHSNWLFVMIAEAAKS